MRANQLLNKDVEAEGDNHTEDILKDSPGRPPPLSRRAVGLKRVTNTSTSNFSLRCQNQQTPHTHLNPPIIDLGSA
jgi:hypothetical protein